MRQQILYMLIAAGIVGFAAGHYIGHHVQEPAPPAQPADVACGVPGPPAAVTPTVNAATPAVGTQLTVTNQQTGAVAVFVAFGADSAITAADWAFCTPNTGLTCNFLLAGSRVMPNPSGKYVNATMAFRSEVSCGATKVELNLNNPKWYDTLDISLVDGFSNKVSITYSPLVGAPTTLGPPAGATGNEKVFGVFPYGCDICVARENPPCGIPKGTEGCKSGTQYKPDVPCQFQGAVMGGGGNVEVALLP